MASRAILLAGGALVLAAVSAGGACCLRARWGQRAPSGRRSSSARGVSAARARDGRCLALGHPPWFPRWARGRDILLLLRQGPPWPALGTLAAE